jgi:hypothetical protein
MTLGFDVFVQLVIAATTTEPWSSPSMPGTVPSSEATAAADRVDAGSVSSPVLSAGAGFGLRSETISSRACWNLYFAWRSETRSCGRFGPARLGSIVDRSSSTVVV